MKLVQWAIAAVTGGVLMACVVVTQTPSNQDSGTSQVSQHNPDLVRLVSFGRTHRQCLAWTNWKRTCSRLSPGSDEIHCNESSVRVVPSRPFCLAEAEDTTGSRAIRREIADLNSPYNRFCTSYRNIHGHSICFDRDLTRPFSGLRIAELRHPYCEIWGNPDGQYCTEKPDSTGLPSCQAMAQTPPVKLPLTCFKEDRGARRQGGCGHLNNAKVRGPKVYSVNGEILNVVFDSPVSPVANPYCSERTK